MIPSSPDEAAAASPAARLPACCVALLLTAAALWSLAAWHGWSQSEMTGVLAATIAAAVCLPGGLFFLFCAAFFQGQTAVAGALLGMLIRMQLPLACGMVLTYRGGPLAEAGVFGMIVVFYLALLLVETVAVYFMLQPVVKTSLSKAKAT